MLLTNILCQQSIHLQGKLKKKKKPSNTAVILAASPFCMDINYFELTTLYMQIYTEKLSSPVADHWFSPTHQNFATKISHNKQTNQNYFD